MINIVQFAAEENVHILTVSYGWYAQRGSPPTETYPYDKIMEKAVYLGMVVTLAAGNEGPGTSSLCDGPRGEAAIAVGMYYDAGTEAWGDDTFVARTSRGPGAYGVFKPEIVAPGVAITVQEHDGSIQSRSGTSYSAPHVAGAAALLKEKYPTWGPWEIRMALVNSARRMDNHPFTQGAGALNAENAVFNEIYAGVLQWYDFRDPTTGDQELFGPPGPADNIVGWEAALSPTWSTTVTPGGSTSTTLTIFNYRAQDVALTFSFDNFADMDNTDRPFMVTFEAGNPVVPAGSSVDLPVRLAVYANQYPGVYAACIELSDGENIIRVPVAVTVPALASQATGRLTYIHTNLVDNWETNIHAGDWHWVPIYVPSTNVDNITVTLDWPASGAATPNDLDIYLVDPIGRGADNYDETEQDGGPVSVSVASPENAGLWWAVVHAHSMNAPFNYTLTIDINGENVVQVSPDIAYHRTTHRLDLRAYAICENHGPVTSGAATFTIFKDNSNHPNSHFPDNAVSDIDTGYTGNLSHVGGGVWEVSDFDVSGLLREHGEGLYYAHVVVTDADGHRGEAASRFFILSVDRWTQTDWSEGPTTPAIESGKWHPGYGGYYRGENVREPPDGKLTLGVADGGWFNENWPYRRPITIENVGTLLENYQVPLVVTYDPDMQADFDDLRFTDNDGVTLLPYWTGEVNPGENVEVWVRIPSIPANENKLIYMYYGNPGAETAENGEATFVFYESFEDGDIAEYTDAGDGDLGDFVVTNFRLCQRFNFGFQREEVI